MKYKRNVYESLVLIMQFGINMLVPILLCTALGVYLSDKTGHPFLVVPLFFVGAIAGFQNIFRMSKKIYQQDSSRDSRENVPGQSASVTGQPIVKKQTKPEPEKQEISETEKQ